METITYEYEGGLYVNLTNRCDCNCVFQRIVRAFLILSAIIILYASFFHEITANVVVMSINCGLFSLFPDYSGKIFLPSPHLYFQNLKV